jgi:hypothetical protein
MTGMTLAGKSPAQAAADAPGFLRGFRLVGAAFVLGNALVLLSSRGYAWVHLCSRPPWTSTARSGLLPSVITDGGAFVLALAFVSFLVRYRRTWARTPLRT